MDTAEWEHLGDKKLGLIPFPTFVHLKGSARSSPTRESRNLGFSLYPFRVYSLLHALVMNRPYALARRLKVMET